MSKGKLFILSGCSGVGKSTVLTHVMAGRDDLRFSVSATTRKPRPGEREAVNYYFVSHQTFQDMIQRDEFLEYDEHMGNFYGTPIRQLEEKLFEAHVILDIEHMGNFYGTPIRQLEEKLFEAHVILDIEPMGAFAVRAKCPEAVLIFIAPPSVDELERRLRGRGDTSEEQIAKRMERAIWELEQSEKYDHIVVNEQVEICAKEILNIIAKAVE